ncbi:D-glycerate 2-kinase (EC [Olavius sp. associated proteobacterium Delta 1]|nr:D-glycerate 2-kinase (EC [Olavius sp. associated proteobacterium Delta 1]
MTYINNRKQLLSHGNLELREAALDIIDHALAQADPYQATRNLVRVDGNHLLVGELSYNLAGHKRIFLLGGGKATYPIARALEDLLGERITDGVVICKYGQEGKLSQARLYHASHPIPDKAGFEASRQAIALARQTQPNDIVFGCITGGSSALMPLPVDGVTLGEKKAVNRLLLTCGANIYEINAVRKHLSQIKGGRLARAVHPRAQLINLTVSDVTGDELDYITDPTVPDSSFLEDARTTLTKYDLWDRVPAAVGKYLKAAGAEHETPKTSDLAGHNLHSFILVKSASVCEAAADKASELGFKAMILSTVLEGESKELGRTFAAIAREIISNQRPLNPPCAVIGGGETTVKIDGTAGEGGPNQEFSLASAPGLDKIGNVVVVGLDSDGTDGPTDIAGGMVDNQTLARANDFAIDIFVALAGHDVTPVLKKLGDDIETGATGTNVNDLKFMLIS